MEPPGTAPGSDPFIPCAFIAIVGKRHDPYKGCHDRIQAQIPEFRAPCSGEPGRIGIHVCITLDEVALTQAEPSYWCCWCWQSLAAIRSRWNVAGQRENSHRSSSPGTGAGTRASGLRRFASTRSGAVIGVSGLSGIGSCVVDRQSLNRLTIRPDGARA